MILNNEAAWSPYIHQVLQHLHHVSQDEYEHLHISASWHLYMFLTSQQTGRHSKWDNMELGSQDNFLRYGNMDMKIAKH